MTESAYVEILNDDDEACKPGEIGRIVVTPLHNFITPLLRYTLDDFAEVGEPCTCGRGLPTLKRILGRSQNQMVMPGGNRVWMSISTQGLRGLAPVIQHQIIQKSITEFHVQLVVERPLTDKEETALRGHLLTRLNLTGGTENMSLKLDYVDAIAQDAGGKLEEFICHMAAQD